ncbi:hypothetical protein M011DRAFT_478042 [Sporormia fimetaria CBS 119925]|uniref:HTH La-type RNA-binding domain-containing protein n=1 Tax=Sporormia fimetaria CBS 119925 TaxID=1340428 RepID=A0A6A6VA62_9PLEO|nr:hypothetical protein M011DRAFT_478042 [Sporormia fimetaria CBS 119925]
MSAQSQRPRADGATAPATFSYAQAAKGLSSPPAASVSEPQPTDEPSSSKDASTAPSRIPIESLASWADDAESQATQSRSADSHPPKAPAALKQAAVAVPTSAPAVTSPSSGPSSSVTAKDEDNMSVQNNGSESASNWENKSQASTSVEKSSEAGEKRADKPKGKADRSNVKPVVLAPAPPPAVNIWAKRADELKAKAAQKPTAAAPDAAADPTAAPTKDSTAHAKNTTGALKTKPREEGKTAPTGKEGAKMEDDKARRSLKNKQSEKETKSTPVSLPLHDTEAWPTPESIANEDKKKTQPKKEEPGTERKPTGSVRSGGKHEWEKMNFTPSVVFQTPLPSASSRRGGRGGGRGGSQASGRSTNATAYGPTNSESEAPASAMSNGDASKRVRPELSEKATSVTSSAQPETKPAGSVAPKTSESTTESEHSVAHKATINPDSTGSGQNHSFPHLNKHNKRRGGYGHTGERRKDGEHGGQSREGFASLDRRASSAAHPEVPEGERRTSHAHDATNGHARGPVNERRTYPSFSGRDRPRGGGSRGRGGFQSSGAPNGMSATGNSGFAMRSPTTFHPEQPSFFSTAPHGRFPRNGQRAQTTAAEAMYGRPVNYAAPPMQPYFDYSVPPVAAASPISPYESILALIKGQMEHYFSIDNLCSDMYLRKHMDSKGFVRLDFIAGFNRMKALAIDLELVKYACHQSETLELRVGLEGEARVRRREKWDLWVLEMSLRDPSAQNAGPEDVQSPVLPQVNGLNPRAVYPGYPGYSAPIPLNGPQANGEQDSALMNANGASNGHMTNGVNGFAGPNGHLETSTLAVSGEPDSFSDSQVEALSVIVRNQEQLRSPSSSLSASGTFSNGSLNSKSGVGPQQALDATGVSLLQGSESAPQDHLWERKGPSASVLSLDTSTTEPSSLNEQASLHWVKGQDIPVHSLPPNSIYEPYSELLHNAIKQRQTAPHGSCPHDMDILYQFWSHFLVRNFNLHMYQEFRHYALDDSRLRGSNNGLTHLISFYGEALLSTAIPIRETVARHYVELVGSDRSSEAFIQLREAMKDSTLHPRDRSLIYKLMDPDLRAAIDEWD